MAVRMTVGNTGPSLPGAITLNGAPVDLTSATVRFRMRPVSSAATKVDALATITSAAGGAVRYDWQAADVETPGDYLGWWSATVASGQVIDTAEFVLTFVDHGLTTAALCTIADLRAADPAISVQTASSPGLFEVIDAASAAISKHTRRRFGPTDATATPELLWARLGGAAGWDLDIPDAAEKPTGIRLLAADAATEVASLGPSAYVTIPLGGSAADPVTAVRVLPTAAPCHDGWVEVTARWGFPTIPPEVRRAAVITCVHWLRDARAITAPSPAQYAPDEPPQRMLPMAAVDLLRPYRRMVLA